MIFRCDFSELTTTLPADLKQEDMTIEADFGEIHNVGAPSLALQVRIEGRDYGIQNGTINSGPTEKTFDFTIL